MKKLKKSERVFFYLLRERRLYIGVGMWLFAVFATCRAGSNRGLQWLITSTWVNPSRVLQIQVQDLIYYDRVDLTKQDALISFTPSLSRPFDGRTM